MSFLTTCSRCFALLLCTLILTACSNRPAADIQLSADEQALVRSAAYIAERSPLVAEIWPGFWSPREPFMLYQVDELALLVTDKDPIAGYQLVDDRLLPQILRGRAYFYPGSLPRLESVFVLRYPVQNYQVTAVRLQPELRNNANTMTHEAFHAYQHQHFKSDTQPYVEDEVFSSSTVRTVLRMQQRLLQHMLNLSGQELNDFAHDYLTLRLIGEQILPDSAIQLQRYSERTEGSAQLIGLKTVLGRSGQSEALIEHLYQSLEGSPDGIQKQIDLWSSGYHTGASLMLILTRFDLDWQRRLADGQTFEQILAEATNFDSDLALTQANDVLARHDFDSWMAWAETQSMRASQPTLSEFLRRHPYWVELHIQIALQEGEPDFNLSFSGGPSGMSRPQEDIILLAQPESLTFYHRGLRLVAQELPALINTQELNNGKTIISVAPSDLPQLCDGEQSCTLENLGLTLDGLIITSEDPVTLEYQDSRLRIHIN